MSEREPRINNPENLPSVRELLDKYNIPYQRWGSEEYPAAQTLKDLEREVEAGYAALVEKEGELVREVSVALVDIQYTDDKGSLWKLVEAKRVLHGDTEDEKHTEIGKRIQEGESAAQAAMKALTEAGIVNVNPSTLKHPRQYDKEYRPEDGWKYPGLRDLIHYHEYVVGCTSENINLDKLGTPTGYRHQNLEPDKVTQYEWKLVGDQKKQSSNTHKNFEEVSSPEKAEKPPFLYHASLKTSLKEIKPHREYSIRTNDKNLRVWASEDIAHAAARRLIRSRFEENFQFKINYESYGDRGEQRLILEVDKSVADRLEKPVCIYKLPSDTFIPKLTNETSSRKYESPVAVQPAESPLRFKSFREAIESSGGVIRIKELFNETRKRFMERRALRENPEEERKRVEELQAKEAQAKKEKAEKRRKEREKASPGKKQLPETMRPTKKQEAFLTGYGVDIPPTKKLSSRMISFILKGNGTKNVPDNKFGRAAFLAKAQRKWNGQRVINPSDGREGIVKYIFPRNPDEVDHIAEYRLKQRREINPFIATVQWSNETGGVVIPFSYIRLVAPPGTTNEDVGPSI
ncbi:MAG: hypothetical protein WD200_04905 [Candidatus Andersenbacteria bacterium]